jgi:hypothetical protein
VGAGRKQAGAHELRVACARQLVVSSEKHLKPLIERRKQLLF